MQIKFNEKNYIFLPSAKTYRYFTFYLVLDPDPHIPCNTLVTRLRRPQGRGFC
jgi:hypothetical protein